MSEPQLFLGLINPDGIWYLLICNYNVLQFSLKSRLGDVTTDHTVIVGQEEVVVTVSVQDSLVVLIIAQF